MAQFASTPRMPVITDLTWALPLTLLTGVGAGFSSVGNVGAPGVVTAVLLAITSCALLLISRRVPALVLVGTAALMTVHFAVGLPDGPIWLPLIAAAFFAGRYAGVRTWAWSVVVAACVVLVGFAMRTLVWDAPVMQSWWQSVGALALCLAAALLGSVIRGRVERARERVARVATEEQLAMARDLHDGVGHGLAVIAMQAGVALHVLDQDPAAVRRSLQAIRDTSRESLEALRGELSKLAGQPQRSTSRTLADVPALVDRVRAAGLDIAVDLPRIGSDRCGRRAESAAYSIVQESLTNVLRHSDASAVEVVIDVAEEALIIEVRDDGTPRKGGAKPAGLGLAGMRQRASELGGECIAGFTDRGFLVSARIPVSTLTAAGQEQS
ncbi:sensor histidine kinase [Cumulibacter soli]|uniref:sensor histidine kinase n=1 Tax=Cumulibacter soli TaxID=2546344 RepID=UPI0010685F58|nr:histidine kinase [Cumulibacter soli]